ncbi:hypothetical protein, partial [Escherichia coli]|uniref:hypothetical protein n=1 Tax=Escherichia coli TaxID=562 RepID=UPI001F3EA6A5
LCSRGGLLCLPDQLHFVNTVLTARLLMFLQELQFTGGKRCFCSYLALRDSVGQILPPLQS